MRVQIVRVVVAGCAAFVLGCGSSPPSPSGVYAGTWTGSAVDGVGGAGTASLAITQSGNGLTGTWTTTFTVGGRSGSGSLSGTASALNATIAMTPGAVLVCSPSQTLSGTITLSSAVNGTRMMGTYSTLTCTGAITGNVELVRQ